MGETDMGIAMKSGPRGKQQGMAVIMALLIVALATTAASLVLWQQGLWWHQLDNDRNRAQLRLVADAGLGWAMEILRFNNGAAGNGVVALSQLWAQPLPQTEAQGVTVAGQLSDLQGRFNLNSLVQNGQPNARQLVFYKRLLTTLGLPTRLSDPLVKRLRGGRTRTRPASPQAKAGRRSRARRRRAIRCCEWKCCAGCRAIPRRCWTSCCRMLRRCRRKSVRSISTPPRRR